MRPSSSDAVSSSSLPMTLKKRVGGSCFVSPAITTCVPRTMAPAASSGAICDASSKITTSNLNTAGSINVATLPGDIIRQGFKSVIRRGISASSLRSGFKRRFFAPSRRKIAVSAVAALIQVCAGRCSVISA